MGAKVRKTKRAKAVGARGPAVGERKKKEKGPAKSRNDSGFRQLARRDGYAARITVAERAGGAADECAADWIHVARESGGGAQAGGHVRRSRAVVTPRTCRALAALGHAQRLRIVVKLLEGPGTYRTLQKATKLKPGPLYHHVNQLRLAGLLLPSERDLYELTRGGRNLILTVLALGPLVGDRRRRA